MRLLTARRVAYQSCLRIVQPTGHTHQASWHIREYPHLVPANPADQQPQHVVPPLLQGRLVSLKALLPLPLPTTGMHTPAGAGDSENHRAPVVCNCPPYPHPPIPTDPLYPTTSPHHPA